MTRKLIREICLDCEDNDEPQCPACIGGYRYYWTRYKRSKEVAHEIEELLRLQAGLPVKAKQK